MNAFKMKKLAIAALLSAGASISAYAAPAIEFLGTNNTSGGASQTFGGSITATAWTYDQLSTSYASDLWFRNEPANDLGLGVCSEGSANCSSQGGQVNELSNQVNAEYIQLYLGAYTAWTDIWVSSLDGTELGSIYWGNSANGVGVLGLTTFSASGPETRSIWAEVSAASGWDPTAKYLFFFAGSGAYASTGGDNDYLVYGVTAVPEPETYAMLLAGLGLMGFVARRRQRKLAVA